MTQETFTLATYPFTVTHPAPLPLPEHFLLFQTPGAVPEYSYSISLGESLEGRADMERSPVVKKEDLLIWNDGGLETRLLSARGNPVPYGLYRETSGSSAEILLNKNSGELFSQDTVFTSLFALERRLIGRGGLILHCAYVRHGDSAILFSAPSGTGKSTQADLWERYQGAETINGDRALLLKKEGQWQAFGFPVCGSSEICRNVSLPIRAIVLLSQAKENLVTFPAPMKAYALLYREITVNSWNREQVQTAMGLLEDLIRSVPVLSLACDISPAAVDTLCRALPRR